MYTVNETIDMTSKNGRTKTDKAIACQTCHKCRCANCRFSNNECECAKEMYPSMLRDCDIDNTEWTHKKYFWPGQANEAKAFAKEIDGEIYHRPLAGLKPQRGYTRVTNKYGYYLVLKAAADKENILSPSIST